MYAAFIVRLFRSWGACRAGTIIVILAQIVIWSVNASVFISICVKRITSVYGACKSIVTSSIIKFVGATFCARAGIHGAKDTIIALIFVWSLDAACFISTFLVGSTFRDSAVTVSSIIFAYV